MQVTIELEDRHLLALKRLRDAWARLDKGELLDDMDSFNRACHHVAIVVDQAVPAAVTERLANEEDETTCQ